MLPKKKSEGRLKTVISDTHDIPLVMVNSY